MKIAIIGGAGKMGRWLSRYLKGEGFDVVISGRDKSKLLNARKELGVEVAPSNGDAVKKSDAVIVSVPIDSFEDVIREIAPHTRPDQMILDITSVKVMPVSTMHKYLKGRLTLGVHPVFGPGAVSPADHNFILTPTNKAERDFAAKVKSYLEGKSANVAVMTPEEHDRLMAVVLGLSHFIAIVSADTLVATGRLKELKNIGGITYKALLTLIESVISEDPKLYSSIQMNLPDVTETHANFIKSALTWMELVNERNYPEFIRRMQNLKSALEESDPDFGQAYEKMYRLARD